MGYAIPSTSVIKKLLALFALALLIILSQSNRVNAASIYDGVVVQGQPYVKIAAVPANDDPQCNVGASRTFYDWYEIINDPAHDSRTSISNIRSNIDNAIANPSVGGFFMRQNYNVSTGISTLDITTWTGTPSVSWTTVSTYPVARMGVSGASNRYDIALTINCSPFNDDPPSVFLGNGTAWSSTTTLAGQTGANTFLRPVMVFGSYNNTYPTGYAGINFNGDLITDPANDRTFTDFDVVTNGLEVTATYNGNSYDDPKCTYINWRFIFIEDPEDSYDPLDVGEQNLQTSQELNLVAPDSGFYRIDAQWTWASTTTQMNLAGLNTSNLSYCQSAVSVPDNGWISVAYADGLLPHNTGKVFPLDRVASEVFSYSLNRVCEIDDQDYVVTGFYPPSMLCIYEVTWTLQDCTTFGVDDLGERISCEFGNFIKQLRAILIAFFVPAPQKITAIFQDITNDISQDESFLTYPLAWLIETMTAVTSESEGCVTPSAEIFEASTTFDLCKAEDDWPTAWNFAVTIFRMAFALMFIIACYKIFTNLWSRENDI